MDDVKGKRHGRADLSQVHALFTDIAIGEDKKAPTRFRIFKAGINTSTKGPFLFDDRAADMVMANFASHGVRLTMDYEHQSLLAQSNGQPAPASAYSWVPQVIDGELWATDVKWTSQAERMIEAREYNYQSPLFKTEAKTNRVTMVVNLALTNVPALDDQAPLIAASANDNDNDEDDHMKTCKACGSEIKDGDSAYHVECATSKMTALSTAIGLRADTATDVLVAEASGLVMLRSELSKLTGGKSGQEILGVVLAWKGNADEVTALKQTAADAATVALRTEFDGVLDLGLKELKVAPAERASLESMVLSLTGGKVTKEAVVGLRAHLATRSPIAVGGSGVTQKGEPINVMTPEDHAVAKMLGNDPKLVEQWKLDAIKAGAT